MILSVIQARSGARQNGVNLCTRKKETPKVPVPQTCSQSPIPRSQWVGTSQSVPWAPALPWGWPGKGIAVICWSSFVVYLTPRLTPTPAASGVRPCKCGYITSGLIPVPNKFYLLDLMPEPRNLANLRLLGVNQFKGIRSHLGCLGLHREQRREKKKNQTQLKHFIF